MTSAFEHSSLRLRVTEQQRDRALDYLQRAYAEGRLDELDFEARMSQVLAASNRKELNSAFKGLVHIPISSAAVRRPGLPETSSGQTLLGITHLSAIVSGPIGPGIMYAIAPAGSRMRAEAAKSLNYQLVLLIAWVITLFAVGSFGGWLVMQSVFAAAFVGAHIVNGSLAMRGQKTWYPSLRVIPDGAKRKQLPGP